MRGWKVGERRLAALLGCERQPITGRAKAPLADLLSDTLAVEVKCRKAHPVFLVGAMRQAERGRDYAAAKDGRTRLAIVVLHADHQDYENDLVVMRARDFTARLAENGYQPWPGDTDG